MSDVNKPRSTFRRYCCVRDCMNSWYRHRHKPVNENESCFKAPTNAELFKQWKNTFSYILRNDFVCERHFLRERIIFNKLPRGKKSLRKMSCPVLECEENQHFMYREEKTSKMIGKDCNEMRIVGDDTNVRSIIKNIINSENVDKEAFHVLNVGEIVARHKRWLRKIPNVTPHFAIKSNSDPIVIKLLAELGASFDCASKQEIIAVQKCGVPGERIIYASAVKSRSYISYAKQVGVDRMTVDCETELFKIKQLFPEARIVIRILCDSGTAGMPLGLKFGCDPQKQAFKLADLTKKLGLHLHGFSFHVGSPCGDQSAYAEGIRTCEELIKYARSIGCSDVCLIDIGGGIPGESEFDFDKFADKINDAIKDVDPSIKFISEPGRYYVLSSGYAAACVEGKKTVIDNGRTCFMYYLNDGIFGSFSANIMRTIPELLDCRKKKQTFLSKLWGPSGDPYDYIVNDYLPELEIGDWLLWKNMGAYTTVFSNSFNGFQPPVVFPFIRESEWNALQ